MRGRRLGIVVVGFLEGGIYQRLTKGGDWCRKLDGFRLR